jgi:hypothetical protein
VSGGDDEAIDVDEVAGAKVTERRDQSPAFCRGEEGEVE